MTLSIVRIDKTSFGYYTAKLAHERAATAGPVPATVLRATQFHELPARLIALTCDDSRARVFDVRVQTVAAQSGWASMKARIAALMWVFSRLSQFCARPCYVASGGCIWWRISTRGRDFRPCAAGKGAVN